MGTAKLLLLSALGLGACDKAKPGDDRARPVAPRTADAAVAAPRAADAAPPATPDTCAVQFGLTVTPSGDDFRVEATATNAMSIAVTVELTDRCPNTPLVLFGLPASYDFDDACTKGACADPVTHPILREVPIGSTETLATWTIHRGKTACNAALPAGRYELSFVRPVVIGDPESCGPATTVLEIAADPEPDPKPDPRPHPKPDPTPDPDPKPRCKPMRGCAIGCRGPMRKDASGCTLCACADDHPGNLIKP